MTSRITYVVQMLLDVGERMEYDSGYIRFGLYGDDCPGSVKQMLLFLTRGISSLDKSVLEDRLEIDQAPVSLLESGGAVQNICPEKGIDLGVASQMKAYARNKGLRTVSPDFVPQSRPLPTLEGESFPRLHNAAGLISVPAKGIGWGNPKSDFDEAFASAFTITASSDSSSVLDKAKSPQRVIGQLIDNESMEFLDRLSKLPIQKKIGKGGEGGPPLLKVRVRDVDVQKVKVK